MEQIQQAQPPPQGRGKYEQYLRIFKQYFQYVVIVALGYVVYYEKKENEKLREDIVNLMQKDINDKSEAIDAWRKTKDGDNELLNKLLDRLK